MSDYVNVDGVKVSIDKLEELGSIRKEDEYPRPADTYWYVDSAGAAHKTERCAYPFYARHKDNHNVFCSRKQAKKAAKMMRRSNAIIRACLLVDPDYEPDWDDYTEVKYSVYYLSLRGRGVWDVYTSTDLSWSPAYVSSISKAREVCELLNEWGVK